MGLYCGLLGICTRVLSGFDKEVNGLRMFYKASRLCDRVPQGLHKGSIRVLFGFRVQEGLTALMYSGLTS